MKTHKADAERVRRSRGKVLTEKAKCSPRKQAEKKHVPRNR